MLTHTILDASSVELWLVICEATTTGASKEHCRQLDGRNHGLLALLNSLKHPRGKRSETRFFLEFFLAFHVVSSIFIHAAMKSALDI